MNKVTKTVSVAVVALALLIFILLYFYGKKEYNYREVVQTTGKQVEDVSTPIETERYIIDDSGSIVLPTEVEEAVTVTAEEVEDDCSWGANLLSKVLDVDLVRDNDLKPRILQVQQLDEGVIAVLIEFEGTDLQLLAETSNYEEWDIFDVTNKYGSDYPLVIWQTLPADVLGWYDVMYSEGLDGVYKGEVISTSQCVLTDLETNEERVLFK